MQKIQLQNTELKNQVSKLEKELRGEKDIKNSKIIPKTIVSKSTKKTPIVVVSKDDNEKIIQNEIKEMEDKINLMEATFKKFSRKPTI